MIKQLWIGVLGDYSLKDLSEATQSFMSKNKTGNWPKPAHILHILQDWGAKKEKNAAENALASPEHQFKQQRQLMCEWYYDKFTKTWPYPISHGDFNAHLLDWWRDKEELHRRYTHNPSWSTMMTLFFSAGEHIKFESMLENDPDYKLCKMEKRDD
jgi:hypothetical protein